MLVIRLCYRHIYAFKTCFLPRNINFDPAWSVWGAAYQLVGKRGH